MAEALLRKAEVLRRTGHSKSEWHRRINRGIAPRAVSIGPRAVAWLESEIDAYVDHMIKESRQDQAAA